MATIDAEQQQQPVAVVTETAVMEPTTVAVVVADAPASESATSTVDPAAVAISKRAAKKIKKSKSSNATQLTEVGSKKSDKDEEENANNIATVDHPYLSFLHKRIRLYKKKLEKIKSLETAQSEDGKVSKIEYLWFLALHFLVN